MASEGDTSARQARSGGGSVRDTRDVGADTTVFDVSDQYIVERARLDPILSTFWGVPGHDHALNDFSPDGWAERLELERTTLRRLDSIRPRHVNDRIAIDVLRERATVEADMIDSGEYQLVLAVLNGHHSLVRDIFDFMPRDGDGAWDRIHDRLLAIPDALDGLRRTYVDEADRGRTAAQRQALACADQCQAWARDDGCFADIATECGAAGTGLDISPGVDAARRAFHDFGAWLRNDYAPIATERDAIGRDRYHLLVRLHNGADLELQETYEWGWHELRSIIVRMNEIAGSLHPDAGSLLDAVDRIARDPRYVLGGPDAFIEWSQTTIDRTLDELSGTVFDIPDPLWTCRAMQIPSGVSGSAYYTPPSEDFSRPGMVWQPVAGRSTFPLWDALTTLYHESVPGHHLQLGHMMYLSDSLTRFQRLAVFVSAHGEGWALYAERLMHELGYLADPVYELGWLAGQALRAARVVVDIGLHCELTLPTDQPFHPGERWDPGLACDFLVECSGLEREAMRSEVDRYLGMPAQAISYKVGERVWVDGRDRAKRRLGADFDLKRFHAAALDLGAMSLDQLSVELDRIVT